ncbi:exopolyphosphatase [Thaumasiovibrio subtropicus]|uniref:exopolyphosphatase n=1 Tax=Thaumasiovibrio subtropicus TaxID=1891207 RepID=UPI000B35458B|nr:exopolyphosphatase [Thaumasiovibrio subtropicus]
MSNPIVEPAREIAAIDIGSNSFHLVVAKVIGQRLQIISRHKQRVRLAAGLDENHNLDHASMQRGLDCLTMFAERLQGFHPDNVRIAATYTLRQAQNAHLFLQRARNVIPYQIEIIPGTEEARLIYLGVAHTQPKSGTKLVIDIGGGSTELIIGEEFEAKQMTSKHMGCVSYNKRFFSEGKISKKRFEAAQLAAAQKLENVASRYKYRGWDIAIGASGTIKTICEVIKQRGSEKGTITRKALEQLGHDLIKVKHYNDLDWGGLSEERKPIIAAGLAILTAVFAALDIDEMHFSDGALREGLLYEMEERFRHHDIRERTTNALAKQYHVDLAQAERIKATASMLYSQIESELGGKQLVLGSLLKWAAVLHEVGLSISYSGFHRHCGYILQHASMPGFNQEEQTVLATLTRFQRKTLKLNEMPELSIYKRKHVYPLIRTLRLAVAMHGQRNDDPLPTIKVTANKEHWQLHMPSDWQVNNRLLEADLVKEQEYWQNAGWQLEILTPDIEN